MADCTGGDWNMGGCDVATHEAGGGARASSAEACDAVGNRGEGTSVRPATRYEERHPEGSGGSQPVGAAPASADEIPDNNADIDTGRIGNDNPCLLRGIETAV